MLGYDEYIHTKYNISYYIMLSYILYWSVKSIVLFYVLNPFTVKYIVSYII